MAFVPGVKAARLGWRLVSNLLYLALVTLCVSPIAIAVIVLFL
jgi:hypothetical protein